MTSVGSAGAVCQTTKIIDRILILWGDCVEVIELISTVISNLGVPVGCLCGAFWLLNKERIDHKEEVASLREQTKSDNKAMIDAVNNNTVVIQRLMEKLT